MKKTALLLTAAAALFATSVAARDDHSGSEGIRRL